MAISQTVIEVPAAAGGEGGGGTLTLPDGTPRGGVVLLPPVYGVNDYIRGIASSLAERGLASIALDYWAGRDEPDLSSPPAVMQSLSRISDPLSVSQTVSSVAYLRAQASEDLPVATLGFCVGGSLSLLAAADKRTNLACAVVFYGVLKYKDYTENKPESPVDAAARLETPLLAHFGERDHVISGEDVAALRSVMVGKHSEIYQYPGAGHAFHEYFRPPIYAAVAADEAWHRTVVYFDFWLKKKATK